MFEFRHRDFGESDIIGDFEVGVDRIDLSQTEIDDFADLLDDGDGDYAEQIGAHVLIHSSDEDTILVANTYLGDLNPVDFIF